MKFQFNLQLYLYLTLGFIIATVAGTQTHEWGHYFAARYFGFDTNLHYASVTYDKVSEQVVIEAFYNKNKDKILAKETSPEKEHFVKWYQDIKNKYFLITIAGPLQTIVTGTLGLILLLYQRKKIIQKGLQFYEWIVVFLTFFWSRQLGILIQKVVYYVIEHRGRGDEEKIARYLNINQWVPALTTGIIAFAILFYVVFRILPAKQRFTFLIAGASGCFLGAIIWFGFLGPVILP